MNFKLLWLFIFKFKLFDDWVILNFINGCWCGGVIYGVGIFVEGFVEKDIGVVGYGNVMGWVYCCKIGNCYVGVLMVCLFGIVWGWVGWNVDGCDLNCCGGGIVLGEVEVWDGLMWIFGIWFCVWGSLIVWELLGFWVFLMFDNLVSLLWSVLSCLLYCIVG